MRRDYSLHLPLVRLAVTCERLFDLVGRIFENSSAALVGSQEHDPSRMSDGDPRRNVLREKQFLERRFFGLKLIEKLIDALLENTQAKREILVFRRFDYAVIDRRTISPSVLFDHPPAHRTDAGVKP